MTESQKERKAIDGLREKVIDVLAGRSPAVFMAWNNVNPPKSEQMKGLAEQLFHDLFAHEDCPEASLITALYDDSVRIKMREYIERSINDAAACTVGQMTQQRLDEVAYGYR